MTTPSVTDSVGEGVSGDSQTTFETATLTPSGSDRYLLALVSSSAGTAADVSAVKFASSGGTGGQSMTLLSAQEDHHQNGRMSLWGLLNPGTSAGTVWAQWGAAQDERAITAVAFQDVDQSTPVGTDIYGGGTATTSSLASIAAVAGDLVADFIVVTDVAPTAPTVAPNSSQSEVEEHATSPTPYDMHACGVLVASGTSETRGWVITGSPSADMKWGMFGIALKQSGGGGGGGSILPLVARGLHGMGDTGVIR